MSKKSNYIYFTLFDHVCVLKRAYKPTTKIEERVINKTVSYLKTRQHTVE